MGKEALARKMPEATAELSKTLAGKEPNLKVIPGTLKGPSTPTPREKLVLLVDNSLGRITPLKVLRPEGVVSPDQRDIDEVNGPEKSPTPRVTIAQFHEAQATATNTRAGKKDRERARETIERYHGEHADPLIVKQTDGEKTEAEPAKDDEYDPKTDPKLSQRGQIHPELALKLAGVLAGVGLAVTGGWGAITGMFNKKPDNSAPPTPIVSPSASGGMPSASASIEATPLPTASPSEAQTLSPEQQLQKTFEHWLDPTTPLPDLTRFYFSNNSKAAALANMLEQPGGSFNSTFKDQTISHSVPFEGLPIALSEVKASNGKSYVIVYELQESAADKNGVRQRYVFPVNYGPLGTSKIDTLTTAAGVVYGSPTQRATSEKYPIPTIEKAIQQEIGKGFMEFNISYITSKDVVLYELARDPQEITTQNATARFVLLDSWQLLNNPFDEVTLSSAFKKIINNPVKDGFNLGDVPMCVSTATQDTPDLS